MAPKVGVACWDPPKAKPPAAGAAPLDGAAGAEPKAKLGGDAAAAPKLKPPWEDWDGFAAAPYDGGGGWPKVEAGAPEKRELNLTIKNVIVMLQPLTCSWHQKTNSPIHEFKVLYKTQEPFKTPF